MIPTRSMTQSAIFLLPESLQLTFTFQIRFHIFPPLNTLFHIIFQIFPSLISMGEFAIQATDNFFKNRILSNDNKAIIDAALPTVIIFVSFLAAFIALYICCCCCSTQRNASCTTNNWDALIPRVEKLENFFAFYVNEKFHELQNQDILEAAKNKTK